MSDQSSSDDLWANTAPQPSTPPPASPGAADPTQIQPAVGADATAIQPVTPGPAESATTPPLTPPPAPPGGGGDRPGGGSGSGGGQPPSEPPPPAGRPDWAGPAIAGLLVGGIVVAMVVFALTRGGDDSVQTVDGSTTTVLIDTTLPTDTTIAPDTTTVVETTIANVDTTIEPAVTEVPVTTPTTEAPVATEAPTTDPPDTTPDTTAEPTGPAIAAPGTVRIDGVEYGIERSCFTQPLAPRNGDLQVFSQLIRIDGRPAIVEQWFDEGGISGGALAVGGFASDIGEMIELEQGYALESPAGSGNFGIVANPTGTGDDCGAEQGIQTFDSDDDPRYLRALVDACIVANEAGESTVVGYGTDLGRVEIKGAGDGTYAMTYRDMEPRLESVSAELLGDGSSIAYSAPLDGGRVVVYTDDALLRDCTNADLS